MDPLSIFNLQNPWRREKSFHVHPFIERDASTWLSHWLENPDVLVILGPRQSGKTTLIKRQIQSLVEKGLNNSIFYFNLDNENLQALFKQVSSFVKFIQSKSTNNKRAYIFIDEIQRVKNAGLFLKQIQDLDMPFKLIISGSSSLEVKAKTKEHLTGRKKEFLLTPLSFAEFLKQSLRKKVESIPSLQNKNELLDFTHLYGEAIWKAACEYLLYGGYPKVVMTPDPQDKIAELAEIYSSYLKKDVQDYLGVENVEAFNKLVSLSAFQLGNLVNFSELASSLQITRATVKKYLTVLQDSFVLTMLPPFFTNRKRELVKNQKVFWLDNGLRNFIINNFTSITTRGDHGALIENFVFNELTRKIHPPSTFHFWRTQTGAEVDFVIRQGEEIIPIEVKSQEMTLPRTSRSFLSFLNQYHPEQGFFLNRNLLDQTKYKQTTIHFIPFWLINKFSF
ncbi:ATP-binding protein [Patescibacteria group bacterium]|nr:ATP-binding protein [Patescibacteria group bacterium]